MTPTQNLAVVAQGLAKLTGAYQNLPKITGLTQALLLSVQELENVVWTVLNGVNLNPATPPNGQNLTNIAMILNISRDGMTDAQLWTAFKLELLVLRSRGRSEDVLQVANAMTPSALDEYATASMLVTALNAASTLDFPTLVSKLGAAKDAGARLTINYSTWPNSESLILGSAYGTVPSATPLASDWGTVTGAGILIAAETVLGV